MPDRRCQLNRSMQHHLVDLLLKDGVYERRKTIETFSHPENRDLEPLEVRAVVAWDRARLWQAPYFHSLFVVASRRDSSSSPPTLSSSPHPCGARGPLARDRFRFVDSWDSQTPRSSCLDGEPGGHPPWWPSCLSRP